MTSRLTREELIDLVIRIRDAQDEGRRGDVAEMIALFQENVPCENATWLFEGDNPVVFIVDYALGWRKHWPALTKPEMISLVRKIAEVDGTEAEVQLMIDQYRANCKHPAGTDLIYWPDGHFDGTDEPTAEQIVEKAMHPVTND